MEQKQSEMMKTLANGADSAVRRQLFDPNQCLTDVEADLKEQDAEVFCWSCQCEQPAVISFEVNLENGVDLTGDDLGDNLSSVDNAVSTIQNIVECLEEFADEPAPIKSIGYGVFCTHCLESVD